MRRRTFAAPFVITAACSGGGPPPFVAVKPPPPSDEDRRIAHASQPDAMPAPPDAGPPRLVRGNGESCWEVPSGANVACPAGGPTVLLPSETYVRGRGSFIAVGIDEDTLVCSHEFAGNPPGYTTMDHCPTALMPALAAGVTATRTEDRHCWYGDTEVRCHPDDGAHPIDVTGPTVEGRILDIKASGHGAVITIGLDSIDGILPDARGWIDGVSDSTFVVSSCTRHSCTAKVSIAPDRVRQSNLLVQIEHVTDEP